MLLRLWRFLFPPTLERMLGEASEYGRLTLTQTAIDPGKGGTHGVLGWQCYLRAHERPEVDGYLERHPQFSWKGEGATMAAAIEAALEQAREMGGTARIMGDPWAPKLGRKAYDD